MPPPLTSVGQQVVEVDKVPDLVRLATGLRQLFNEEKHPVRPALPVVRRRLNCGALRRNKRRVLRRVRTIHLPRCWPS